LYAFINCCFQTFVRGRSYCKRSTIIHSKGFNK